MKSVKWDLLSEEEQLRIAHTELNSMRDSLLSSNVTITGTLLKDREEIVLAKLERGTFFVGENNKVVFYL